MNRAILVVGFIIACCVTVAFWVGVYRHPQPVRRYVSATSTKQEGDCRDKYDPCSFSYGLSLTQPGDELDLYGGSYNYNFKEEK